MKNGSSSFLRDLSNRMTLLYLAGQRPGRSIWPDLFAFRERVVTRSKGGGKRVLLIDIGHARRHESEARVKISSLSQEMHAPRSDTYNQAIPTGTRPGNYARYILYGTANHR